MFRYELPHPMAPHTCSDLDSPLPPVQPASASAGIRPSSRQRGLERPREDAGSPGSRRPARPPRFPHTVPLVGNQEPVKASLSVAAQLHQLQGRRLSDPAVILGDLHTARLSRRDASVAASASCRRGVEAANVAGRWGPPPLSLRVTSGGHSPPASRARAPSPRPRPTLGPSTCRPQSMFPEVRPGRSARPRLGPCRRLSGDGVHHRGRRSPGRAGITVSRNQNSWAGAASGQPGQSWRKEASLGQSGIWGAPCPPGRAEPVNAGS